jgi:hypothetical protein
MLQFAALALLPLAMFMELSGTLGEHGLSEMLKFMVFGIALFYTGRLLQGYSKT